MILCDTNVTENLSIPYPHLQKVDYKHACCLSPKKNHLFVQFHSVDLCTEYRVLFIEDFKSKSYTCCNVGIRVKIFSGNLQSLTLSNERTE